MCKSIIYQITLLVYEKIKILLNENDLLYKKTCEYYITTINNIISRYKYNEKVFKMKLYNFLDRKLDDDIFDEEYIKLSLYEKILMITNVKIII